MQNSYDVPKLGRIQISLSNGYDQNIVAAAMELSNIKVEVVGFTEEGIRLLVTHPNGVKVNILENTESHHHFYADTDNERYKRLFVPRRPGNGVVLIANKKTVNEDLLLSRKYPIVIEPVLTNVKHNEKLQLLIASPESIKVERTERTPFYTAHNPLVLPEELIGLMSITEEKIPVVERDVDTLSKRIKNVRELFQWYDKKVLGDEARESLKILITKLNDFQIRADAEILKQMSDTTKSVNYGSLNQDPLDGLLEQFKGEDGFIEVCKAVKTKDWMLPPIHNCECGAEAVLESTTIQSDKGPKNVFFVHCTKCANKSNRNDWGLAAQTMAAWNKKNGSYKIGLSPLSFGLEGLNENQVHSKIKKINTLVMNLVPGIKMLPPSLQEALDATIERSTEIQIWSSYIRMALKQNRNK